MEGRITKSRKKFSPVSIELTFESIEELAYVCALFNVHTETFRSKCRSACACYPEGLRTNSVLKTEIWKLFDSLYNECRE